MTLPISLIGNYLAWPWARNHGYLQALSSLWSAWWVAAHGFQPGIVAMWARTGASPSPLAICGLLPKKSLGLAL
jgi:hypothetical protein